jgi:sorting nexin-25
MIQWVAALALLSLVIPPVNRHIFSFITVTLGLLATLLVFTVLITTSNVILGIFLDRYYATAPRVERKIGHPLLFSTPAAWQAALVRSQWAHRPPQSLPPIVPGFPAVSQSINEIMIFIVRDFVLKWYKEISSSPTFPTAVSSVIHASLQELVDRLQKTDVPELIVKRILPTLTDHVAYFRESESSLRGTTGERHLTRSEELDILLSSRYTNFGKLHPAISNLSTMSTRPAEEEYLRRLLDKVLPHVLPKNESQSRSVLIAVREIVACNVLAPLMEVISDPDVWNRAIDLAVSHHLF